MSFDEFLEFQNQLDDAQKEQEQEEKLKKDEKINDFGFSEVLKARQEKKDALKLRLEKQNFSKIEIEKLFKIIYKAEQDMELIKSKFDYKSKIPGAASKMQSDLIEIQMKMKKDFDLEFNKILKEKRKDK